MFTQFLENNYQLHFFFISIRSEHLGHRIDKPTLMKILFNIKSHKFLGHDLTDDSVIYSSVACKIFYSCKIALAHIFPLTLDKIILKMCNCCTT